MTGVPTWMPSDMLVVALLRAGQKSWSEAKETSLLSTSVIVTGVQLQARAGNE